MKSIKSEPQGQLDPEPYTVEDFARETVSDCDAVRAMMSNGQLKTVTHRGVQRICASEACRVFGDGHQSIIEGVLTRMLERRLQIAQDLRSGLVKEAGVDRHGCMLYQCSVERIKSEPQGQLDPEPYTVEDFARETHNNCEAVRAMMSNGQLKTVTIRGVQRICASEACRLYGDRLKRMLDGVLAEILEGRRQLALDLQSGRVKEAGVGLDGCVLYERATS